MRPVDKGAAPTTYARYPDALTDLRGRLGDYCSYCERQIETGLAVEHIQPQASNCGLRNSWANFLLACVNCNSSKGKTPVVLLDYFWPNRDNTLRAFEYVEGGLVRPKVGLSALDHDRARDTIALTGLDKFPVNSARQPTASDRRWLKREETWQLAEDRLALLAKQDTPMIRKLIVDVAKERGMFSIWWTVFAGDIDMRRRLRKAFIGTHRASFDFNENLVPRLGGQL